MPGLARNAAYNYNNAKISNNTNSKKLLHASDNINQIKNNNNLNIENIDKNFIKFKQSEISLINNPKMRANATMELLNSVSKRYDVDGQKNFIKNYDSNTDLSDYDKSYNSYYLGGKYGTSFNLLESKADFAKAILSDEVRKDAYLAGKKDGQFQTQAMNKNKIVEKDGGIIVDRTSEQVKIDDIINYNVINEVAKKLKVAVQIVDHIQVEDGSANGYYNSRNAIIKIAKDSENPIMDVFKHEATHRMQDINPQAYNDYKTFVMKTLQTSNSPELTALYEKYEYEYNHIAELELNETKISDEIVADFTSILFQDENKLNDLVKQNRTFVETLLDVIREIIRKIDNVWNGKSESYYEAFEISKNDLIKAEKMLSKAINREANADDINTGSNDKRYDIKQVENYINEEIRHGKDVQFTAIDGDILTITSNTSGKAKFRNKIKTADGERLMTNNEYKAKLEAESHIDELAQISKKVIK